MSHAATDSCPFCGANLRAGDEACPQCDLPLLGSSAVQASRRARSVFDGAALFDDAFPEYDEPAPSFHGGRPRHGDSAVPAGRLRCVVVAINQAEAEMLCGMLRHEGVPCMVRTPDLHSYAQASLRCEVLVPEEALPLARQLLRIEDENVPHQPSPHLVAGLLTLLLLGIAAVLSLLIVLAA